MSSKRSRAIGSTVGSPPASVTAAASGVRVAVHHLSGTGVLVDLDQLGAGREDRHPGTAVHDDGGAADRRQHAQVGGAEHAAGPHHRRAGLDVLAREADVGARTHAARGSRRCRRAPRCPRRGPRCRRPSGTTEPVKIFAAVPGLDRARRAACPAGAVPTRRRVAGALRTSSPRTAKPSMAELAAAGTARPDTHVLGGDAAGGGREEDALRAQHRGRVEHGTQRLGDGDHGRAIARGSGPRNWPRRRLWTSGRRAG